MRKRLLLGLGVGVLGAACAVAIALRSGPDYLARGREAIERGDLFEAERLARLAEERDQADQAQLLRGLRFVADGRTRNLAANALGAQDLMVQGSWLCVDVVCRAAAQPLGPQAFARFEPSALPGVARLRPAPRAQEREEARGREAFRNARVELRRISDSSPLYPEAALLSGECFYHLGERDKAASAFRVVVQAQPDHAEAHRWLAAVYLDLNAVRHAVEHLHVLARLEPDDGRPHREMGRIYRDFRQIEAAIQAYRTALARRLEAAARADAVHDLAQLLVDQGQHDEALEVLRQCPAEFALRSDHLALRAEIAREQGKRRQAIELAEAVLARDPDSVRALVLSATLHLEEEENSEAAHLLRKAAALAPHEQRIRERLAQAYERLGRPELAQEQRRLKDALDDLQTQLTLTNREAVLRPSDDAIRYQMALLWLKMERPAEARTWLRATLTCNPEHQEARALLRKLDGLPANEARP